MTFFLWAWNDTEKKKKPFPASTSIRIDVAHLMAAAARWECFRDKHKFRLKRFYMRAIALLVDCESVREFQSVFLLICLVALMPVNDYAVKFPRTIPSVRDYILELGDSSMTAAQARAILEEYISLRGPIIDNLQNHSMNEEIEVSLNYNELPEEIASTNKLRITHQWIRDLILLVTPQNPESVPGEVENGLYFPPIITELERIGKEFPLWSSAALPTEIIPNHATTASQEGYFKEVKHRVFEGIVLPCTCHRFLREHLDDISSQKRDTNADLQRFVHKQTKKSPSHSGEHDRPKECHQDSSQNEKPQDEKSEGCPPEFSQDDKPNEFQQTFGKDEPQDFRKKSSSDDEPKEFSPKSSPDNIPGEFPPESSPDNKPEQSLPKPSPVDKPEDCDQTRDKKNENTNSAPGRTPLDDSDFFSKMQWRGLLNDEKKNLWQQDDTNLENSPTKSPQMTFNTDAVYSDILRMETASLLDLLEEDLWDKDDNNNVESTGDYNDHCQENTKNQAFDNGKQKCKGLSQAEQDRAIHLKKPQFSSTLEDEVFPDNGGSVSDDMISIAGVTGDSTSKDTARGTRQQGKAPRRKKETGYFAPYPQMKILNLKGSIRKAGNFLQNGLICPVVKYSGLGIKVNKTCGFDSFVHILEYAALDDSNYRLTLEKSTNPLAAFVIEFLKHGCTTTNMLRRCALLCGFYPLARPADATTLEPYVLDATDTLTNIWEHFFIDPVAHRKTECDNIYCSIGKSRALKTLAVNHHFICDNGFKKGLPGAIDVFRSWQCTRIGCHGTVEETLECGHTVFIELDIRDFRATRNEKVRPWFGCTLDDIPEQLHLGNAYR